MHGWSDSWSSTHCRDIRGWSSDCYPSRFASFFQRKRHIGTRSHTATTILLVSHRNKQNNSLFPPACLQLYLSAPVLRQAFPIDIARHHRRFYQRHRIGHRIWFYYIPMENCVSFFHGIAMEERNAHIALKLTISCWNRVDVDGEILCIFLRNELCSLDVTMLTRRH